MYVVVAGAGHVGVEVARALLAEGHSVAVIESNRKRLQVLESLDVLAVEGSASSPRTLAEAGVNSADMLIAVTGSDETNIVACVVGKSKGCKTVARLRSPDFIREGAISGRLDIFSIDLAVSQDMVTASHISKVLLLPSLFESGEIAEGRSLIIELKMAEGNASVGKMPGSIRLPQGALISSVCRDGQILDQAQAGAIRRDDRVILVLDSRSLVKQVEHAFGVAAGNGQSIGGSFEGGVEKVVIVGATRVGIQVAGLLEKDRATVLVDADQERCARASEFLEKAIVIQGDATDANLFRDEGLDNAAVLVAATDNSEFNMLSCLLARKRGVPRTMSTVDEPELRALFEQVGVDIALSPRKMVVDFIIQHISGTQVSSNVTNLQGSGLVAMEVVATDSLWMVGKEYGHIKMPKGSLIGTVIRNGKASRPSLFDIVRTGDRIIVMVLPDSMRKVEKLFSYRSRRGRKR